MIQTTIIIIPIINANKCCLILISHTVYLNYNLLQKYSLSQNLSLIITVLVSRRKMGLYLLEIHYSLAQLRSNSLLRPLWYLKNDLRFSRHFLWYVFISFPSLILFTDLFLLPIFSYFLKSSLSSAIAFSLFFADYYIFLSHLSLTEQKLKKKGRSHSLKVTKAHIDLIFDWRIDLTVNLPPWTNEHGVTHKDGTKVKFL